MIRNMRKNNKRASEKHNTPKFAGIHTKNKARFILKSNKTRLRKIGMIWHCSMLCLLSGGPRVYAGPL
ncbi:hypothetical protein AMJ83_10835 [candidate division WOR_3 bacterium SM23_42]|uniref:Uncharacterized protein n=1 Tax=candidate division WOR_3 bacterium SM23_42 TaxID=1703779 RepID=A0A0S8FNY5_UNCW3|nr:MAG: hypothetical protein AMJ83_10835 [candidate division WOR_3 bacterium SM23_42]